MNHAEQIKKGIKEEIKKEIRNLQKTILSTLIIVFMFMMTFSVVKVGMAANTGDTSLAQNIPPGIAQQAVLPCQ